MLKLMGLALALAVPTAALAQAPASEPARAEAPATLTAQRQPNGAWVATTARSILTFTHSDAGLTLLQSDKDGKPIALATGVINQLVRDGLVHTFAANAGATAGALAGGLHDLKSGDLFVIREPDHSHTFKLQVNS